MNTETNIHADGHHAQQAVIMTADRLLRCPHRGSIAIPDGRICPSFIVISCLYPAGACRQVSVNDSSCRNRNRRGVRGPASQPRARRIGMHPGALVLFRGPADRDLLPVLNAVAGERIRPSISISSFEAPCPSPFHAPAHRSICRGSESPAWSVLRSPRRGRRKSRP